MPPLYIREITYRAYVYADSEWDAAYFDSEIVSNAIDPDDSSVKSVTLETPFLPGWGKGSLVYHEGSEDLTVESALLEPKND